MKKWTREFEKVVGRRYESLNLLEIDLGTLCGSDVHCIESESDQLEETDYMIDFEIEGDGDVYALFYLKDNADRYYITEV